MKPDLGLPDIDSRFFIHSAPTVAAAGILSGMFEGIYLLESVLFPVAGVLVSIGVWKAGFSRYMGAISLLTGSILLAVIQPQQVFLVSIPFMLLMLSMLIFMDEKPGIVLAAVIAQLLDAFSTVIVIDSGGSEKMALPALFIDVMGSSGIYILKALVLAPFMVYALRNDSRYLSFLVYSAGLTLFFHNLAVTG